MEFGERAGRRGKGSAEDCSSEQLAPAARLGGPVMRELCPSFLQQEGLTSLARRITSWENVFFYCLIAFSYLFLRIYPTVFKTSVPASSGLNNWRTLGEALLLKNQQKITCWRFQIDIGKGTHRELFANSQNQRERPFPVQLSQGNFAFSGSFGQDLRARRHDHSPQGQFRSQMDGLLYL